MRKLILLLVICLATSGCIIAPPGHEHGHYGWHHW